ncbi:protein FAR-RED IMPAIRED RESPONSE 1-like [Phoenix dactylifera]|uniref:Protein FAR1-RELATED SEQUENCE n=1 Tax=Phoenix dactylifera TaxID=42345 RepID=A0A8B8IZR4_PHODC|nr:protein FAR-RED IMPAIRED RESPONSE 1-like [Phoenix dactylifera]
MAKALASQWLETKHRLCIWHMYQNAGKKLNGVFGRYSSFAKDFSSCVYDHDDEDDFLHRQFEIKEKWAFVYGSKIFCADMSTTQRSESMNSRLVDDRRFEELRADFKATQSRPTLEYPVEILKHAASVYTPAVFKLFSHELWLTWDCELHKDGENGSVVLSIQNFKRVPNQYILKRWSKDAKDGSAMNICVGKYDQNGDVGSRYRALLKLYSNLAARAAVTNESFGIALDAHESTLNKVEASLKNLSIEESTFGGTRFKSKAHLSNDSVQPTSCEGKKIKGIKLKGRQACGGTSHRIKGALERATRKRKPQTQGPSNIQLLTQQNFYGANLNTRGFTETLNLIQAQLPKIREQRNDEDAG